MAYAAEDGVARLPLWDGVVGTSSPAKSHSPSLNVRLMP